jgi:hypothetical protein
LRKCPNEKGKEDQIILKEHIVTQSKEGKDNKGREFSFLGIKASLGNKGIIISESGSTKASRQSNTYTHIACSRNGIRKTSTMPKQLGSVVLLDTCAYVRYRTEKVYMK